MFSELIKVYALSAITVSYHFCVILNSFFLEVSSLLPALLFFYFFTVYFKKIFKKI